MATSLIKLLQRSIQDHWTTKALSDYHGDDFTYGEVAHIIDYYHGQFRERGIRRGDHIALCGNGCARWGIAFMAVVSYGAVAVDSRVHLSVPEWLSCGVLVPYTVTGNPHAGAV